MLLQLAGERWGRVTSSCWPLLGSSGIPEERANSFEDMSADRFEWDTLCARRKQRHVSKPLTEAGGILRVDGR